MSVKIGQLWKPKFLNNNPVIVSKIYGSLIEYYPLKDHDRTNRLFLYEFTTNYKLFRDVD